MPNGEKQGPNNSRRNWGTCSRIIKSLLSNGGVQIAKNPRDANKTRWSRIDVDPSQLLLGPSSGICSNLLKIPGFAAMVKLLISQACLTLPDDQIRCESYCRRFTMICSQNAWGCVKLFLGAFSNRFFCHIISDVQGLKLHGPSTS